MAASMVARLDLVLAALKVDEMELESADSLVLRWAVWKVGWMAESRAAGTVSYLAVQTAAQRAAQRAAQTVEWLAAQNDAMTKFAD